MNNSNDLTQILVNENSISLDIFIINLLLAFLLSFILTKVYIRYGRSLSNRSSFAENFILITMTTMTIITIVKSSLALSLGLVGALSIVRFRTALKEPEELSYTFFCIAIGLGLGASQTLLTIIGFLIITLSIYLRQKYSSQTNINGMNLFISSPSPELIDFDLIVSDLSSLCESLELKRISYGDKDFQSSIVIQLKSYKDLEKIRKKLYSKYKDLSFDFTDTTDINNF